MDDSDSSFANKRLRIPIVSRIQEGTAIQKAIEAVCQPQNQDGSSVQVILVGGEGGQGKTTLVSRALASNKNKKQCLYAETKFHQRQSATAPFEGLRVLVADLVDAVRKQPVQDDSTDKTPLSIASIVANQLSRDQQHALTSFSPAIQALLESNNKGHREAEEEKEAEPSTSTQKQDFTADIITVESGAVDSSSVLEKDSLILLTAALQAFIRAISSSKCPIILQLDDIHWSCDATLQVLQRIVLDSQLKNVLLAATFRVNEETATANFYQWRNQLEERFQNTTNDNKRRNLQCIHLESFTLSQIQELVAESTQQEGRRVQEFAETVHQFTRGNPFFVKHFLEKLQEDGLLAYDWTICQWTWDIETIKSQSSIADNLVETLVSRMHKLTKDVRAVLGLASCFGGAQFDANALYATKKAIDIPDNACIDECLAIAKKEEYIIPITSESRYKFAHDMIGLTAYGFLPKDPDLLRQYHWIVGSTLLLEKDHVRLTRSDNSIFFSSVDQLNLGADIQHCGSEQRVQLAEWNYEAGRQAAMLSAFAPASRYLYQGLEALGCITHQRVDDDESTGNEQTVVYGWTTDEGCFGLATELYTLFTQTQFCLGENGQSIQAAQQVLDHARTYAEKLPCLPMIAQAYVGNKNHKEMVTWAVKMLASMGEKLPKRASVAFHATVSYQRMKQRLASRTDDEILSLPLMTDKKKECILTLLAQLIMPLWQLERDSLSMVVAWRMIQITLSHGISRLAPECFAVAASFLAGYSYDLQNAYRLVTLTEQIIEKRLGGVDRNTANIFHLVFNGGKWWREPISNCLDSLIGTHRICMQYGRVGDGFRICVSYMVNYFYAGLPLDPLLKDVERFAQQFIEYNQLFYFYVAAPLWQCLLNLAGKGVTGDPLNFEDGEAQKKSRMLGSNGTGEQTVKSYKMQIAYFLGDLPKAKEIADSLYNAKPGLMKSTFWFLSRRFYLCLIYISSYKASGKLQDRIRAETQLKIFRKVVKQGAINLVHKLQLLEVEMMTALGSKDHDEIFRLYDNAIVWASRTGFLQDAALGNYLCFRFIIDKRIRVHLASIYFTKSEVLWATWGAPIVAQSLAKRYPEIYASSEFSRSSMDLLDGSKQPRSSGFRSRRRFDPSVAKSHRALDVKAASTSFTINSLSE